VRSKAKVIAIFLADIHLSLKAPLWRSAEPDWLEAQARPLKEVRELQEKYKCLVVYAGDIFDRNKKIADGWNASPELINFAIEYLPNGYAIPGQHDLPNHQYDDIRRSAYWTLAEAGKIKSIKPEGVVTINTDGKNRLILCGFPPGYEIKSMNGCKDDRDEGDIWIAVIHDYIWIPGHSYPKATLESKLKTQPDEYNDDGKWKGYDVVVYGDNHKGFLTEIGDTAIFNCGTLMRRKSDEINYKPQVGLLLESGEVIPYYLDTSEDKHLDAVDTALAEEMSDMDMTLFMDELGKLGKSALDFVTDMKEFLHSGKTSNEAKQIILRAMEK